ncbi:uncharacterized protein [Typha angustifolia]|uniref:uncharacterized protein n=1 Tax=Typha angustifolia TaxID=59011 RepID=UPI003C2C79ED
MPKRRKKSTKSRPSKPKSNSPELPNPSPEPTMLLDEEPQSQPKPEEVEEILPPQLPEPVEDIAVNEEEGPQLMDISPAPADPPPPPPPLPDVAAVPEVPQNPPQSVRKPPGKRKKPLSEKQRAAAQQKLSLLKENLRPVPFAHASSPDLSKHEALFRTLGLWEFAHLHLDQEIHSDLVAQLIAFYDPPNRRSFVNDLRISVSRADLARALGLPVKKEKVGESAGDVQRQELFASEESAAAILEFMSGFMLFQFQDDACILPTEVVAATQMVKEGQPHKVDWAGLMWGFVEKELLEVPKSGVCYYASHLQRLIKFQQLGLFEQAEAKLEPVPEAENSVEVAVEEEEDDMDDGDARSKNLEDLHDVGVENHEPGLSLGLSAHANVVDGFKECKEGEEMQWRLVEEKNGDIDHCFRRCSSSGFGSMEFENLSKGDVEGREEERLDGFSAKMDSLERLTSTDLLQAMETVHVSYTAPENVRDPSSREFLAMGGDTHKNMSVDPGPDGSFFFGNDGKREIGEIDDEDEGGFHHHFHPNSQSKRMRTGANWEYAQPSDFDACIEQMQCSLGKAKMLFVEKEQACMNAQMELQYLNGVLHQKDQIIHSLEKARMEEQQKWQMELCRFEHELNVMAQLVVGYKKALKQTQISFSDYRKKFPQGDEPLYSDVAGGGGLVLSTKELERERLEKEEKVRCLVVEMIDEFQKEWLAKLEDYVSCLAVLEKKLTDLDGEIELLKESFLKFSASATSE